jgi:hypothetical protein
MQQVWDEMSGIFHSPSASGRQGKRHQDILHHITSTKIKKKHISAI